MWPRTGKFIKGGGLLIPARKTNKPYRVQWEIDVDARSVTEAAKKALEIQRDPDSIATNFDVLENPRDAIYCKVLAVPMCYWVGVDLGKKGGK